MTSVSFVKTTEAYQIRDLDNYMGSTLTGTDQIIWVVHLPEQTERGLMTTPDQTVQAVQSCNNWLDNGQNHTKINFSTNLAGTVAPSK